MSVRWARTPEDVLVAQRLRYDVYVEEMGYYAESADHRLRRYADGYDEGADVLIAEVDGRDVGTLRVHRDAVAPLPAAWGADLDLARAEAAAGPRRLAVLTRFVVRPAERGSFLPLEMMREVYRHCLSAGVELALIDCVPHLVGLYRRLGFRRYRTGVNDPDTGVLIPMAFALRDRAHLLSVASPLVDLAPMEGSSSPPVRRFLEGDNPASAAPPLTVDASLDGPLFEGLSSHAKERLLAQAEVFDAVAETVLIRRDTVSRCLYVVADGEVAVLHRGRDLTRFGPGECFGEINFLRGKRRTRDVVALSPRATVLAIGERHIERVVEQEPQLAGRLYRNLACVLAERLARTTECVS